MDHSVERIRGYWRMKWFSFAYNYGWSDYVFLFDGWVAKCAMAIPIVGYLVLFNDSISQHLSFNHLANENFIGFGLTSGTRLKLIYFGLIFLGSANILYRWRRPFVFKVGTNEFDYVETALTHFTVAAYIRIHEAIRTDGHHTLYGKYYDSEYDAFLNLALGKKTDRGHRDDSTADWTSAKQRYEGLLRSMLTENFFRNNIGHRISLTACLVLALIGYLMLLIPSSDLLLKVIVVSLKSLGT